MTQKPTIPTTKRSFEGLDELIDHSISQQSKYSKLDSLAGNVPPSLDSPSCGEQRAIHSAALEPTQPTSATELSETELERLQVKVPSDLLLTARIHALKRKISLSKLVDHALRQYLKLPLE